LKVLAPDDAGLAEAAALLKGGQPVGIPTETVYGLAARFDDPDAVAAVYQAKDRPRLDPLIVHIAHPGDLSPLVCLDGFSSLGLARLQQLMGLWPGPLTLVLPKSETVHDLVTSGLPTVAVRCPGHPVARAIVARAGCPLVAPSANRFGHVSPTEAVHVQEELGERVVAVVDGGACAVGIESTIVGLDHEGQMTLLRPGVISKEDLHSTVGPLQERGDREGVTAPGQMARHYAPRTRLVRLEGALGDVSLEPFHPGEETPLAILCFRSPSEPTLHAVQSSWAGPVHVRVLAPDELLSTAAKRLFACVRELDALEPAVILVEPVPGDTGLSYAINDRLRRASRGHQ
jgi:L-threonylcarbamoyladenylate synthase